MFSKQTLILIILQLVLTSLLKSQSFKDSELPIDERVDLLIDELTLEEKISLMVNNAAGVDRLNIPEYNWWNEGLHGVARSVPATIFPQAIGMAATFDPDLIKQVATVISDEGRAIYNHANEQGVYTWYTGLTYWSPNVNIFRDPRWGRGHETYGEDPYLSGLLGAAFVNGIQGDDKEYLKAAACAKHFFVHNGPEENRFTFDATSNKKDLYETYLPAFQALIDANVAGVMCAYNKFNSESCCGSSYILNELLREEMGFEGYIVSDCGALNNLHTTHHTTQTVEESAALAVKSGVNVNCGGVYSHLKDAFDQNLISENELDAVLAKQLEIRFRLGMFDENKTNPYTSISTDKLNSTEHKELSREVARRSIVLLKNENNTLPLKKDIGQIYVTGNNAADVNALLGNYYGVSNNLVTILEGIAGAVSNTTVVQYNQGFLVEQEVESMKTGQIWNATNADLTIAVIGLNPLYEGENGDTPFSKTGGDRKTIELPENQLAYLKEIRRRTGEKPLIVVVCSGSAIAMPEVHELADAILWAWYPGEQGGNAVADILFGDYSPSGKLPITIYNSTEQLGGFEDYSIADGGRTYRYFEEKPLYPFGFGLSYNQLSYQLVGKPELKMKASESVEIEVEIENQGKMEQDEMVQLYVSKKDAGFKTPLYALKAIKKLDVKAGETEKVEFSISKETLQQVNDDGESVLPKGDYKIYVGTSSPSSTLQELGGMEPIEFLIQVK